MFQAENLDWMWLATEIEALATIHRTTDKDHGEVEKERLKERCE